MNKFPIYTPVTQLCLLTAEPIHPQNLCELWSAERLSAPKLMSDHALGAAGQWEALSAALGLIADGLDHREGFDVSGGEAVSSAFSAIITAQDATAARAAIIAAVEARRIRPGAVASHASTMQWGVAS